MSENTLAIAAADFGRDLEDLKTDYERQVEELCSDIRSKVIMPFCESNGYKFAAGMGDWWFTDSRGITIERETLPSWLVYLLSESWNMHGTNDIGSLVEDVG